MRRDDLSLYLAPDDRKRLEAIIIDRNRDRKSTRLNSSH